MRVTDLAKGRLVAVDTMVFIYHLGADARYGPVVAPLFQSWHRGDGRAVASVLVLTETLVGPLRSGAGEAAERAARYLRGFPNLELASLTAEDAVRSAELRAKYGIATPDALHAATALSHGAEAFITNDRDLSRIEELNVVLLDDLAP